MSKGNEGPSPSPTALFRSLGVGKRFEERFICLGGDHYTERVNAFHLSFALYYRRNESVFRQLLLLEVAQTCGRLRGDWKEEKWMDDLRLRCREMAKLKDLDVEYARQIELGVGLLTCLVVSSYRRASMLWNPS